MLTLKNWCAQPKRLGGLPISNLSFSWAIFVLQMSRSSGLPNSLGLVMMNIFYV